MRSLTSKMYVLHQPHVNHILYEAEIISTQANFVHIVSNDPLTILDNRPKDGRGCQGGQLQYWNEASCMIDPLCVCFLSI